MEPQYAFSIPSLEDDTALDCRIYHPKDLVLGSPPTADGAASVKGAIVAHPYAPLGGCYDDRVVLGTTQALLKQGYVVGTFNFRGAGDSAGGTSWTGKAELQDFISVAGFLIYYLHILAIETQTSAATSVHGTVRLILGGYSYGSLILARLPPTKDIVQRFETAQVGTAAAEIVLRARTLAKQTRNALTEHQSPTTPRGRATLKPESPASPSKRVSPMTVGGEETDPSDRRRSRDSRRSVDVIRKSVEVPHRIKAHMKRRHSSHERLDTNTATAVTNASVSAKSQQYEPEVQTSYLLVSPVLSPFSTNLMSPGAPTSGLGLGRRDPGVAKQYLQHSTLALFGSNDGFTSSKRLKQWAEKQTAESQKADFRWYEVDRAGHFWGEEGVLRALQEKVAEWTKGLPGTGQGSTARDK